MPKVIIYTTPTCGFCQQAKQFFNEKKIEYTEYNVAEDQTKAEEMVKMSGQMGVPVIEIDDDIVIGFNKAQIAQLIGIDA